MIVGTRDNSAFWKDVDADVAEAVIGMVSGRLATVRSKMRAIAAHDSAKVQQQQQQALVRRRSGDGMPRSLPSQAS